MSDVNEINNHEEKEQGMVLFGFQPQTQAQAQAQPIHEGEEVSKGQLDAFFDALQSHVEAASEYEHFTNVTNIIMRGLRGAGNNPEVNGLIADFTQFTNDATAEGLEISNAKATAVNQAYLNDAAEEIGIDQEKFNVIRGRFQGLTTRLETFMRSNPANPAIAKIINRTSKNLIALSGKNEIKVDDYYVGRSGVKAEVGENRELRQLLLDSIEAAVIAAKECAEENKIVEIKPAGESFDEYLAFNITQMAMKGGFVNSVFDENYEIQEKLANKDERINFYKRIDKNLIGVKKENLEKAINDIKFFAQKQKNIRNCEFSLVDVKNLIENHEYKWEEKKECFQSIKECIRDNWKKFKVDEVRDLLNYNLESEDQALEWIKKFGKVVRNQIVDAKENDKFSISDMLVVSEEVSRCVSHFIEKKREEKHQAEIKEQAAAKKRQEEAKQHRIVVAEDRMHRSISLMSVDAVNKLKDADPTLLISSKEYKNLRVASESFQKLCKQIQPAQGKELSDENIIKLIETAEKTQENAQAYTDYKLNALGTKAPNTTELKRLQAAANAGAEATDTLSWIREYTVSRAIINGPDEAIKAVEKQVFNGEVTQRKLAEMLYLKNVKKGLDARPQTFDVEVALNYKTMNKEVDTLMKNEAFIRATQNVQIDLRGEHAQTQIYSSFMQIARELRRPGAEQQHNQRHNQQQHQQQRQNQGPT
ncbi:MAG: hypothetical protein IJR96_03585 [Pseudobutyrivibrio sp.]|nr:hypothetical protein [Pseudobutyrivibrio sp.]